MTALVVPTLVPEPAPVQAPARVLAPAPVVVAPAPVVAVQVLVLGPVAAVQVLALAPVAAVQVLALALVVAAFHRQSLSLLKMMMMAMASLNALPVSRPPPVAPHASRTLSRQTMASALRAPY